jgi:DNA-binding CsgD family transcriptional regulator
LLLVLEDVHWADPESLELLRYVAARLADTRLLLVVTYRMDELTRRNPFYRQLPALVRESEGLRLDLRRLGRNDLAELVTLRYNLEPLDRGILVEYLDTHSEGNPFFAVELLRALEEQEGRGLLLLDGAWTVEGMDAVVVPDLVKQVIDARLARLGDATREPLGVAAVIGQDVEIDLWARAAGVEPEAILAIIEQGVELSLFTASADGARVQFVHALTRETLYEGIVPSRRRLIHGRVAATLQASRPHDADPIAYHLVRAGDPAAPDWLIQAGERAQRAYAWITARDRFMAAATVLENIPGTELTRARLLYRCGRLMRYANAVDGIEHLVLAERLADAVGDQALAADARYSRGLLHCFADEWANGIAEQAEGIATLETLPAAEGRLSWTAVNWMADALPAIDLQAAGVIDPAADTLIAAGINHRRGGLSWFMAAAGDLTGARAMAERFVGLVEGIDSGPLVRSATGHAWLGLGIVHAGLGQPGASRAAFARAREIYARLDHHAVTAFTLLTELVDVVIPFQCDDVVERHRVAREAELALTRAAGALPGGSLPRRAHLVPLYLDGRWDEARIIADDPTPNGNYVIRRQVTRAMAPIALHQGRTVDAWRYVTEVLPQGPDMPPGSAVLADALLLQHIAMTLCIEGGDLAAARNWLEAHRRWLAASEGRTGRAELALAEGALCRAQGDPERARHVAQDTIGQASEPVQCLALIGAHGLLGQAWLDEGRIEPAQGAFRQALALADRIEVPFERARAQLGLARALAGAPGTEAASLATAAQATFRALGAEPLHAEAEALLASLAQGPVTRPVESGLTQRELEVLRLAAQGLTDIEIGERLFISSRTVSQHLRSIYGKLGLRSRSAATRFAIEHNLA